MLSGVSEQAERLTALLICEQMGANMCERESQRCSPTGHDTADTGVLLNENMKGNF